MTFLGSAGREQASRRHERSKREQRADEEAHRQMVDFRPVRMGLQMVDFRPVRMGLQHNQTRVTWYNWEPTRGVFGDAEADIYSAMGKLEAMLTRVMVYVGQSGFLQSAIGHAGYENHMVDDGVVFMRECLDAIGEWRGKVRSYYVVPGRKPADPPEEHAR